MKRLIIENIKERCSIGFVTIFALFLASVVAFSVWRAGDYVFRDSLDFYFFILENLISMIFPFIITFIYLSLFSGEIKNRFHVYTRTRVPIETYLKSKFISNALLTFITVFLFMFSCFVIAYYILPALGLIQMNFYDYGLNETTITEDQFTRYTFTQILRYGEITYGLLYSLWVGINAVCYTSIGFMFLLFIRNQFVALSIPVLIYYCGSFILGALFSLPYQFIFSVFPFGYKQISMTILLVPASLLILIFALQYFSFKVNRNRLDQLT
ncbi:hypothetical protein SAMN05444162_2957 [Paenibacillaceae bacterium GAS479]|nr:hypothetical protein SAMN05444162_2957 [Paenibacillaceae bacterium GAS479]